MRNQRFVSCLWHRRLSMVMRLLTLNFLAFNLLAFNWVDASESKTRENSNIEELNFRVLLDDREIGFHRFRFEQATDTQIIAIEANFKVTFFAIPFYRYTHTNREVWRHGCLESIRSSTDDNGDQLSVDGARNRSGFSVNTGKAPSDLNNACVMTFAYWDKNFLKQQQLLNAQNGEWLPVDIDFIGLEAIDLGDRQVMAKKYRIRNMASEIDITVWYDNTTDRWLSLESRVSSDRLLRYLPISAAVKTGS